MFNKMLFSRRTTSDPARFCSLCRPGRHNPPWFETSESAQKLSCDAVAARKLVPGMKARWILEDIPKAEVSSRPI